MRIAESRKGAGKMAVTAPGGALETENDAVVVPLIPHEDDLSTEAMLRMLLNREALLINRVDAPKDIASSGMIAQTSGAFAKAIAQAIGVAGRAAPTGETLYRVVLPTGAVARDLVPAVGGGVRGIVRAAGSTKIAGHARFLPAAAGAGGAIAAGPLIATVGLAVAGEMLVQHQMTKKLEAIRHAVASLEMRADEEERSVLTTAAQQSRKVAGYLLDQARIPSISSAAHAFGELDTLTNTYISRLDGWVGVAQKYQGFDRVYAPDLMRALVGKRDNQTQEFQKMVAQTYEALALRARVVVLEKVAAEFHNRDRSLLHVESVLRNELTALSDRQAQLVGLLDDLNVLQVDGSKVPIAFAGKGTLGARTTFSRLARALHAAPDGVPILTDSDQAVLELKPCAEGLAVTTPVS